MDYVSLLELGISLLSPLIDKLAKSKVPSEVIQSLQAAYDKLVAHKDDVVTKAFLEANRG